MRSSIGNREAAATPIRVGDIVWGLLSVVFGGAVLLHSRGFPSLPGGYPGPGLFPQILGGLLILMGAVLCYHGARPAADPSPGSSEDDGNPEITGPGLINALSVLGSIVAYAVLVDRIGFPATATLISLFLMWKLKVKLGYALLISIAASLLVFYLFARVLYIPLPLGPMG